MDFWWSPGGRPSRRGRPRRSGRRGGPVVLVAVAVSGSTQAYIFDTRMLSQDCCIRLKTACKGAKDSRRVVESLLDVATCLVRAPAESFWVLITTII